MIEENVGIICACLPTLRALLARFVPALATRNAASYGRTTRDTGSRYRRQSSWKKGGGVSANEEEIVMVGRNV